MASNENKKKPDGIINLDAARKNSKAEPAEKEVEYTIYVPPVIDRITEEIKAFKNDIEAKAKERGDEGKKQVDKGQFICLLSGISTCRKTPGIPHHMGYKALYKCRNEQDAEAVRKHLEDVFNIHDEESMKETMWGVCVDHDYRQFESFWDGHPVFDVKLLKTRGRSAFESAKECASRLAPFVGPKGFMAWDVNEQVGMCRRMFSCGLLTEERFIKLTVPLAKHILKNFNSWEEYAVSCLCGAVYFGFRNHDTEQSQWEFFFLNKKILESLLSDSGAWGRNQFTPL